MDPLDHDDPRSVAGYRLLGRLGAGGMGRVYLALSPGGRQVAVKVVRPEFADDPGFRQRFAREVAAARLVSGVFTAPVLEADPAADPPWLVTGYVPGPSLAVAVERYGRLPVHTCEVLAAGLAEALAAIHVKGLVHRDLKPSNVLLAADGPRVIDFGIVRAVHDSVLTRAGSLIGTPSYMSPEQIQNLDVGPASDVFALGAVVIFASTGKAPFSGDSLPSVLYRVVNEHPELAAVPPQLLPLVQACLAKDPGLRPSPDDLLRGLRQATGRLAADTSWLPHPLSEAVSHHRTPGAPPANQPSPPPQPPPGGAGGHGPAPGAPAGQPVAAPGPSPVAVTHVGDRPGAKKHRRKLPIIGGVATLLIAGIVVLSNLPNDDSGGSSSAATPAAHDPALCGGSIEDFDDDQVPDWTPDAGKFLAYAGISGGKLKFSVKNGAIIGSDITAPRLTHQIHSNFTFETTVNVAPKFSYQSVGIFLSADGDNYVGLERGFDNFSGIAFEYAVNGKQVTPRPLYDEQNSDPIKTEATTVGLRLVRSGADITAYWRPGATGAWRNVGRVADLPDGLTAALSAQNKAQTPKPDPAKRPLQASFDYLHVTC
jgi:serine/threonine protein kinase